MGEEAGKGMKNNHEIVRIGLAQMNPTVGDLEGNARKIRRKISEAKKLGVQIIAFPELVLCGYPPEDLLLKPRFLADCETTLERLSHAARGIAVLVGTPEPPSTDGGSPHNTCCVLSHGKITARYRKIHLPNYGVFDEKRYFQAGKKALVVQFDNVPIGISICEDIWIDDGPIVDEVRYGGAGIVVNISASPYHRKKGPEREKLMTHRAAENACYVCYVNLVGGQDELVFDGTSVIAAPDGRTVARGRPFEEDLIIADIPVKRARGNIFKYRGKPRRPRYRLETVTLPVLPTTTAKPLIKRRRTSHLKPDAEVYQALVLGTHDYVNKNGFKRVVFGLSGGIDSALTAAITVDALGRERVIGVTMPSGYTSRATLRDAYKLAENLGIRLLELPIGEIFQTYLESLKGVFARKKMDVTEENIQARIRGNLLMALSNKFGWLVLTTGNKSEIAVGYCTLYGDTAGGFAVLKDVPKTLVYGLSRYRNRISRREIIPRSTIRRKPSAELRPGQLDQDTLPPYPLLDKIIELYVERDMAFDEIIATGLEPSIVRKAIRMIDFNEYKRRQGPPGIKITPKAFGRDRRLPITNSYRGVDRGDSRSRR